MKKIFFNKIALLAIAVIAIISSCKKDSDGSPDYKAGTPATSVGIKPDSGSGGTMLTLTGTGLGQMRSIVFDNKNVPARFQSTLNTEENIIFRVPDTAYGGAQNIIFTNVDGKTLKVPFRVLAYPSVSGVSGYEYTNGTQITLTGNNLDDVTAVVVDGTTVAVTVVSKAKGTLVVQFPNTTIPRGKLKITNVTGSVVTTQEFINIDLAYQIFTDNYQNGFGDASWGTGAFISNTVKVFGTSSVAKTYQKGNWHLIQFANWWPNVTFDPTYKYFTFWARGASTDQTLYLTANTRTAGLGNGDGGTPIVLPANTWKYFKLPVSELGPNWNAGNNLIQIGFWIKGPDNQDETFYFDNLLIVK